MLLGLDPTLTPAQVKRYIIDGCKDIHAPEWDIYSGWGFVNLQKSIELLLADRGITPLLDIFEPSRQNTVNGANLSYQIQAYGG